MAIRPSSEHVAVGRSMGQISSLTGIILAWLGVSIGLWALQALRLRGRRRRMRKLARDACHVVDEAQALFDGVRGGFPEGAASCGEGEGQRQGMSDAAKQMLFRLREQSAYFAGASALRGEILSLMKDREHPGLAGTLEIRRDLWGAAEVLLAEGHRDMGDAFAEESDFERGRAEAMALTFKRAPVVEGVGQEDPIDLRLFEARAGADGFERAVEDEIHAARERERLPTVGEIVAPLLAAAWALRRYASVAGIYLLAAYRQGRTVAHTVRQSEAVARGLVRGRRLIVIVRRQMVRWGRESRRVMLQQIVAGRERLARLKGVTAVADAHPPSKNNELLSHKEL
jgi:hypothetical protein